LSRLTINSNIAALNAQRGLASATSSLSTNFTRLSSGLRINKASDDAAGLAIVADLNVDKKIYTQGVRNINDGISYLNIAEGAVGELKNILFRLRELSTQSSNGTLGSAQRQALNSESEALIEEYSRILEVTEFKRHSNLL
jgi:flagellin